MFGEYAAFIVPSYVITGAVIIGMVVWTRITWKRRLREIADLEARGIRRQSARTS